MASPLWLVGANPNWVKTTKMNIIDLKVLAMALINPVGYSRRLPDILRRISQEFVIFELRLLTKDYNMRDREYLLSLLAYSVWANEQYFNNIRELPADEVTKQRPSLMNNILISINHLLVIDKVWLAHMKGEAHSFDSLQTVAQTSRAPAGNDDGDRGQPTGRVAVPAPAASGGADRRASARA